MDGSTPFSKASEPFNKLDTDFVLYSSDRVAFHVWKSILTEASPLFSEMLAPSVGECSATTDTGRPRTRASGPTTPMSSCNAPESSATLDTLLRLCYPIPPPPPMSLDTIKSVVRAALKYQMDGVLCVADRRLVELAEETPLHVYAVAIHFDLVDSARIAARHFLTRTWDPEADDILELDDIPATAYQRLIVYRKKCVEALMEMTKGLGWLPDDGWTFIHCKSCGPKGEDFEGVPMCRLRGSDVDKRPAVWFWRHYERIRALLQERPCIGALADPELSNGALKGAARCNSCKEVAYEHMVRFHRKLGEEVTLRLAQVS
ncbi:hypothetical protein C8Q78DRAFT_963277 [Trametes maxima]|nr:hypothetical protein C8Q78DRAFT_963277 [Trametes maxima]